jgi:hypothetical protein
MHSAACDASGTEDSRFTAQLMFQNCASLYVSLHEKEMHCNSQNDFDCLFQVETAVSKYVIPESSQIPSDICHNKSSAAFSIQTHLSSTVRGNRDFRNFAH